MLGSREWSAWIAGRGGEPLLLPIPWKNIGHGKVIDDAGTGKVTLPVQSFTNPACREVYRTVEQYRHELVLFRGPARVFEGPVTQITIDDEEGSIGARDLYHWMVRRFIDEYYNGTGDIANIFRELVEMGIEVDPSINMNVIWKAVGLETFREIPGEEFLRLSDMLSDLSRTGLDFTMDGRTLLVGDIPDFVPTPLLVLDEAVKKAAVDKDGLLFANDLAVFGQTLKGQPHPVHARYARDVSIYGRVQDSFNEPLIKDWTSVRINAVSRLMAMQPAPVTLDVDFSDQAPFNYRDLIPGRFVDTRIYRKLPVVVKAQMRLLEVSASVQSNDNGMEETISGTLVPNGASLAEIAGIIEEGADA